MTHKQNSQLATYYPIKVHLFSQGEFSSFYPSPFKPSYLGLNAPIEFSYYDYEYPTAEHYFQLAKAKHFNDFEIADKIMATKSPGEAKSFGSKVANYDESSWANIRLQVMYQAHLYKMIHNPKLAHSLVATSGKIIAEATIYDRVWGIGLWANDEKAQDFRYWRGTNYLGFTLMRVRARLTIPLIDNETILEEWDNINYLQKGVASYADKNSA